MTHADYWQQLRGCEWTSAIQILRMGSASGRLLRHISDTTCKQSNQLAEISNVRNEVQIELQLINHADHCLCQ